MISNQLSFHYTDSRHANQTAFPKRETPARSSSLQKNAEHRFSLVQNQQLLVGQYRKSRQAAFQSHQRRVVHAFQSLTGLNRQGNRRRARSFEVIDGVLKRGTVFGKSGEPDYLDTIARFERSPLAGLHEQVTAAIGNVEVLPKELRQHHALDLEAMWPQTLDRELLQAGDRADR